MTINVPSDSWDNDAESLTPTRSEFPNHAGNGDFNRDRFVDTDRRGSSTRVTKAQASVTMDFRSQSQGEEDGSPVDIPDPMGFGGSIRVARTRDPWGTQRPVGGMPDPNVGRPRP